MILTDLPRKYLAGVQWPKHFGVVEKRESEDYGRLTSLRIWHQDGPEVEYGITTPEWAAAHWTKGILVLFDRGNLLSRHA